MTISDMELCNSSNQEKMRFYLQNQDVVKGVSFCATLDFTTCLVCAALDGYVWHIPEEIEQIAFPPICEHCRCVLLPVTELSEINSSCRPAAASDFLHDAETRYAKKFPKKDWNRLSPSTQLKYYYEEQRLFEEETGFPAYNQVSQKQKFSDWLRTQSIEKQTVYLGELRAKLFREQNMSLLDFINPKTLEIIPQAVLLEKYRI